MVDAVGIGPLSLGQEPAAVGAQSLKEAGQTLGVQRAERKRGLARSRDTDDRDQPPEGDVDIEIAQRVVTQPADLDRPCKGERGISPRR